MPAPPAAAPTGVAVDAGVCSADVEFGDGQTWRIEAVDAPDGRGWAVTSWLPTQGR